MRPHAFERSSATTVTLRGSELLAFAGTNYLGFAHRPEIREAFTRALEQTGLSAGASRATSGGSIWHERLEEALAEFLGVEAALVLSNGWVVDRAVGESLVGQVGAALVDADAHPSLLDGAAACGCVSHDYGPGDLNRVYALIDRYRDDSPSVWTDGVFPQVGRLAPLADILRMLPSQGLLVVDDSHGIGVLGPQGKGTAAAFGLEDERVLLTSSLGKALGGVGGMLAGSAARVESVRRRADAARATTAPPPAAAAAACAALELLQSDPAPLERLHKNIRALHRIARRLGRDQPGTFLPVLPLRLADEQQGRALAAALLSHGIFVPWIRYPGTDGGFLRIAVNAEHSEAELARLSTVLAEVLPS